jgi:hypothetical protein
LMKKMFNEEYYQQSEETKPVFDDDLDIEVWIVSLFNLSSNELT